MRANSRHFFVSRGLVDGLEREGYFDEFLCWQWNYYAAVDWYCVLGADDCENLPDAYRTILNPDGTAS